MRTTDAYARLRGLRAPALTTREVAARLGIPLHAATKIMRRLAADRLALRLRRGLWTLDSTVDPYVLAPYLTAPYPSYLSLWSALYHHGMIEQIPREFSLVSLDRSKRIRTPLGMYAVVHIAPELFGGFDSRGDGRIASPEKALFDTVYLGYAGGRRGMAIPEIEFPGPVKTQTLGRWVLRVRSKRLRTLVKRRLDQVLRAAAAERRS